MKNCFTCKHSSVTYSNGEPVRTCSIGEDIEGWWKRNGKKSVNDILTLDDMKCFKKK